MLEIGDLSDSDALNEIGQLIDGSQDLDDAVGLQHGIALCAELHKRNLPTSTLALTHYFESNAWEALRRLRRRENLEALWEWEQPEYEHAILALRRAKLAADDCSLEPIRRAQIATNLANALSHVGRVVEALELWHDAMQVLPGFPMAQGNHGSGLTRLAERTHDTGHQFLLLRRARSDLRRALQSPLHDDAMDGFVKLAERIENHFGIDRLEKDFDLDHHDLGNEHQEVTYRSWALKHRLFLNPLNELGEHTIAAADPLMLPSITQPLSEGPYYLGLFNQLKQEYTFARYSLFLGLATSGPHFSDRYVKVVDTLDYPVYSRRIEEVKCAFRIAYSIFDKTAFFLNHYLGLGIPPNRVTFRNLWYRKQDRAKGLKEGLESRRNISLQALFWVSKDLFEDADGFRAALHADAQELSEIRNQLEHKYLKVHRAPWPLTPSECEQNYGFIDTLAYSISRADLERKAMRVLRLARATLMYLTHCVSFEESRNRDEREGPTLPMLLQDCEDEHKD